MALATLNRQAEDALAKRVHAVKHSVHAELFDIDTPLLVEHGIAEIPSRHDLILHRVRQSEKGDRTPILKGPVPLFGQQVACDLLDDEAVVGQVAVKGVDYPIAVEINLPRHVFFVAVGISVTGGVEPVPAPALAVEIGRASCRE